MTDHATMHEPATCGATTGGPTRLLAALRLLRAPLGALCALLVCLAVVPPAVAGSDVCTGWAVSDAAEDAPEGMDCPFCSAIAPALFAPAVAEPRRPTVATATAWREARRAVRVRAPPLGARAPPLA